LYKVPTFDVPQIGNAYLNLKIFLIPAKQQSDKRPKLMNGFIGWESIGEEMFTFR
jgi:hypothetical protein